MQIFWGDLHRQTAATCGEGTISDHLRVCRDEYGMDFCALTDNAYIAEDPALRLAPGPRLAQHPHFAQGRAAHSLPPGYWEELQRQVCHWHSPGGFVPVLAYEWCSGRWGDRNLYLPEDEGPLLLPPDIHQLLDAAAGAGALVIPHHVGYAPGRRGVDWNVHRPGLEPLAEIYSTQHGCSEWDQGNRYPLFSRSMGGNAAGNSLNSVLGRGLYLGFVAGTDAHQLRQKPALTGVWAPDLTRESLLAALRARRTVASTGPRVAIAFRCGKEWQGSRLALDRLPAFAITVTAPGRVHRIDLVRNGSPCRSWYSGEEHWAGTYQEVQEPERPDNYYYVRVELAGGEQAWASPIRVSYLPEAPFAREILYWLPALPLRIDARRQGEGWHLDLRHTGCSADGPLTLEELAVLDAAGGREAGGGESRGGEAGVRLALRDAQGNPWVVLRHALGPRAQKTSGDMSRG